MANLNHILTYDSSIEEILEQFESRTTNGKLKYNRLVLKLTSTFGSAGLKVAIVIKRTPYYKSGKGFLTFTELKNHIVSSQGYFNYDKDPYKEFNACIKKYLKYFENIDYFTSQLCITK